MALDKNGIELRTGDIVKVDGAYFKNDNGYYFIDRSPGDASWLGSDYSLHKIGKRGKISTASRNIAFWPLSAFCSDQRKNMAAREHNKKFATIEIIHDVPRNEVIAHFEKEAQDTEKSAKRYLYNFGENSDIYKKEISIAEFHHTTASRLRKEDEPTPEIPDEEPEDELQENEEPETNSFIIDVSYIENLLSKNKPQESTEAPASDEAEADEGTPIGYEAETAAPENEAQEANEAEDEQTTDDQPYMITERVSFGEWLVIPTTPTSFDLAEMQKLGGYFSPEDNGYIFRTDPTRILARIARKTSTTTAENAIIETKPEPETAPEPEDTIPGYHGPKNDQFTDEEIAAIERGEQITYNGEYKQEIAFSTPYSDNVRIVYTTNTRGGAPSPTGNPQNIGYTVNGVFYPHYLRDNPIAAKLAEDIDREIKKRVPDEETAKALYEVADLDEWARERTEQIKDYSYKSDARDFFYNNRKPELTFYRNKETETPTLIDYLLNPEKVIDELATTYIESNPDNIYGAWMRYNKQLEALDQIESDPTREEHKRKKISNAIHDEKTVRVLLANGNTVRIEAQRMKWCIKSGNIYSSYVAAQDRGLLNLRESGYGVEDIKLEDIKAIYYSGRTLYSE